MLMSARLLSGKASGVYSSNSSSEETLVRNLLPGSHMQLGDQRASGNVEDRRGMGGMVGGGLGIGGGGIAPGGYFFRGGPAPVSGGTPPGAPRRGQEKGGGPRGAPPPERGQ